MWYDQMQGLTVVDVYDALDMVDEANLKADIARIQDGINTGKVWQDAYDGQLAAGYIAAGLCRERRG